MIAERSFTIIWPLARLRGFAHFRTRLDDASKWP